MLIVTIYFITVAYGLMCSFCNCINIFAYFTKMYDDWYNDNCYFLASCAIASLVHALTNGVQFFFHNVRAINPVKQSGYHEAEKSGQNRLQKTQKRFVCENKLGTFVMKQEHMRWWAQKQQMTWQTKEVHCCVLSVVKKSLFSTVFQPSLRSSYWCRKDSYWQKTAPA